MNSSNLTPIGGNINLKTCTMKTLHLLTLFLMLLFTSCKKECSTLVLTLS